MDEAAQASEDGKAPGAVVGRAGEAGRVSRTGFESRRSSTVLRKFFVLMLFSVERGQSLNIFLTSIFFRENYTILKINNC